MESELFGHKRGSFTGAVADKKGLVQSAEGGTLFLDEVGDLPLHMQVKLLRVVQEKTMRPVGEAREETVDVRILSATHRSLADLVAQGLFREDLFYRINVIELRVPALRERSTDIAEMAEAILQRLARRANTPSPELAADAIQVLEGYPFPGNVRELENVLERAMTLSTAGVITAEHIRLRATARPAVAEGAAGVTTAVRRRQHGARKPARDHRARRHRQGSREDPLQQDGGRQAPGDELSCPALPHQEARDRVNPRVSLR